MHSAHEIYNIPNKNRKRNRFFSSFFLYFKEREWMNGEKSAIAKRWSSQWHRHTHVHEETKGK